MHIQQQSPQIYEANVARIEGKIHIYNNINS